MTRIAYLEMEDSKPRRSVFGIICSAGGALRDALRISPSDERAASRSHLNRPVSLRLDVSEHTDSNESSLAQAVTRVRSLTANPKVPKAELVKQLHELQALLESMSAAAVSQTSNQEDMLNSFHRHVRRSDINGETEAPDEDTEDWLMSFHIPTSTNEDRKSFRFAGGRSASPGNARAGQGSASRSFSPGSARSSNSSIGATRQRPPSVFALADAAEERHSSMQSSSLVAAAFTPVAAASAPPLISSSSEAESTPSRPKRTQTALLDVAEAPAPTPAGARAAEVPAVEAPLAATQALTPADQSAPSDAPSPSLRLRFPTPSSSRLSPSSAASEEVPASKEVPAPASIIAAPFASFAAFAAPAAVGQSTPRRSAADAPSTAGRLGAAPAPSSSTGSGSGAGSTKGASEEPTFDPSFTSPMREMAPREGTSLAVTFEMPSPSSLASESIPISMISPLRAALSSGWLVGPATAAEQLRDARLDGQYDVVELDSATNGHCLSCLFLEILRRHDLPRRLAYEGLPIELSKLTAFLVHLEERYGENPYHNRRHAADVTLGVHRFMAERTRVAKAARDGRAAEATVGAFVGAFVPKGGSSSARAAPVNADRSASLERADGSARGSSDPLADPSASVDDVGLDGLDENDDVCVVDDDSSGFGLGALETLAGLLAAVIHDFNHPGTNNAHEIKKDSHLALRYHDESVLESHHLCEAFTAMLLPHHCFLSRWDRKAYMELRKLVIKLVLMTDLAKHFDCISALNGSAEGSLMPRPTNAVGGTSAVQTGVGTCRMNPGSSAANDGARAGAPGTPASPAPPDPALVLTVAIKGADLGHAIKPWALHHKWSLRVTEEFFALGDRERSMGLPISTFCDRVKDVDLAKSQLGFLKFVCRPFFAAVVRVAPDTVSTDAVDRLDANLKAWGEYSGEKDEVSA